MTVIAYRAGVLASDTLITEPDIYLKTGHAKKIIKTKDGALAGASGDCEYCCSFLNWAQTDRSTSAPKSGKSDSGLLILPNGEIHCYYGKVHDVMMNRYLAIGAGQPTALGAFYMGATAEQAVKAAIEFNMSCGGKITVLSLDSVKMKGKRNAKSK